jgi:hypothetical protein
MSDDSDNQDGNSHSAGEAMSDALAEMIGKVSYMQSPAERQRAQSLCVKYLGGKSNKFENSELERMGIIKKETVNDRMAHSGKDLVNQTELAEILCEKFGVGTWSKKRVSRLVNKWRDSEQEWIKEVIRSDDKICVREFLRRYEENETAEGNPEVATKEDAERRRAISLAKTAERLEETARRKFDDAWMLSSAVRYTAEATGAMTMSSVSDAMEKKAVASFTNLIRQLAADGIVVSAKFRVELIEAMTQLAKDAFDQWQKDYADKMEDLLQKCEQISDEKKNDMKVK